MDTWATIIIGDSRDMGEVANGSVDLVVTSPPYWQIKDYGQAGQIGYGQSLHDYLRDLYRVWRECFRVLRPGGRLCVNVGDQFARAAVYGRYKVIPLHAEIITQGEMLGFDFLGAIIWQKKTTLNTTGGAPLMGSYPYPPNGLVEIDYEFIVILKKPGPGKKASPEIKEASILTKKEWKEYFAGHWRFGGARQLGHEAMFPEELPRRLIRMFTFAGDTVLDPFLGSGTTVKAALELGRKAVGYEINRDFLGNIREKLRLEGAKPLFPAIAIVEGRKEISEPPPDDYRPSIQDAFIVDQNNRKPKIPGDYKITGIKDESTVIVNNDMLVKFIGVKIEKEEETLHYLHNYISGKKVILKDMVADNQDGWWYAYVYLNNKIFVNGYLIKSGLASPDPQVPHRLAERFRRWGEEVKKPIAKFPD